MVNNIQAIEIQQGRNAVTSASGNNSDGVFHGVRAVHCRADGSINVTFKNGTVEEVSMVEDEDRVLAGLDIEILTGTYDVNQ